MNCGITRPSHGPLWSTKSAVGSPDGTLGPLRSVAHHLAKTIANPRPGRKLPIRCFEPVCRRSESKILARDKHLNLHALRSIGDKFRRRPRVAAMRRRRSAIASSEVSTRNGRISVPLAVRLYLPELTTDSRTSRLRPDVERAFIPATGSLRCLSAFKFDLVITTWCSVSAPPTSRPGREPGTRPARPAAHWEPARQPSGRSLESLGSARRRR
jgi:hypothetical protein